MGAIARARSSWATLKLETPIQRTLPSALSCAKVVPALFHLFVGLRPVDLVQVDALDLEAAQARLHFAANRIGLQALLNLALLVPDPLAFREDVRLARQALHGAANDLLGMPRP